MWTSSEGKINPECARSRWKVWNARVRRMKSACLMTGDNERSASMTVMDWTAEMSEFDQSILLLFCSLKFFVWLLLLLIVSLHWRIICWTVNCAKLNMWGIPFTSIRACVDFDVAFSFFNTKWMEEVSRINGSSGVALPFSPPRHCLSVDVRPLS